MEKPQSHHQRITKIILKSKKCEICSRIERRQMKKIFLFIVLILNLEHIIAQDRLQYKLEAFDKIQISGNIDVKMTQTGKEEAILSVNGIESDKVSIEVEGRLLKIKVGFFEGKDALVKVWINYQDIREVNVTNGGSLLFIDPIKSDYMKMTAGTGSAIDARGEFGTLEIKASAGSRITLGGNADIVEFNANTTAEIEAEDLICQEAILKAYTGAKISIHVKQNLEATSATGAEIIVKGNPSSEKISTSTGGIINRKNL